MRSIYRTAVACLGVVWLAAGCSPADFYKKTIKLGVQAVGDEVEEVLVKEKSDQLIGKAPSTADAEFGQRIDTLSDARSPRVLAVYPVKGDPIDRYRWLVESENDHIVSVAKVIRNADIGEDKVKTFIYKEMLDNKTSEEIEQKETFSKLRLVLRRQSNGRMVRVYDLTGKTDLREVRYCLIEFGPAGRMTDLRLVTVPASAGNSSVQRR
jgi:hypothetical protein